MHHKGFQDSGIQEVLEAAGVPKGSFYHYFKNKEDFGIQIIDVYAGVMFQTLQNNLDSPNRPVADAIRGFFREMTDHAIRNGFSGCPLGNLSLEMGDVNELFRRKLNEVFGELEHKLERLIREDRIAGNLAGHPPADQVAVLLVSSWEGVLLRMKLTKDTVPFDIFDRLICDILLPRR